MISDSLAGLVQMPSLGFLGYQVAKAIKGLRGIRIPSLGKRETLVSQVHPGLQADRDQLATLGQWDMGLLDCQGDREMLGYLACQGRLEFQARKANQATSTPKDILDHLDLKVCLVHLDAQVITEHRVPQE